MLMLINEYLIIKKYLILYILIIWIDSGWSGLVQEWCQDRGRAQ